MNAAKALEAALTTAGIKRQAKKAGRPPGRAGTSAWRGVRAASGENVRPTDPRLRDCECAASSRLGLAQHSTAQPPCFVQATASQLLYMAVGSLSATVWALVAGACLVTKLGTPLLSNRVPCCRQCTGVFLQRLLLVSARQCCAAVCVLLKPCACQAAAWLPFLAGCPPPASQASHLCAPVECMHPPLPTSLHPSTAPDLFPRIPPPPASFPAGGLTHFVHPGPLTLTMTTTGLALETLHATWG